MFSCKIEDDMKSEFHIPKVENTTSLDSIEINDNEIHYLNGHQGLIIGKYNFQRSSIDLKWQNGIQSPFIELSDNKDFLFEYYADGSEFSADANGFEVVVDYDQTVLYNPLPQVLRAFENYFPVFIVNSTNSPKTFNGKDRYVYAIQEAYYCEKYDWKPIEYIVPAMCGNGRWSLVINPQEYVLILMRKYSGEELGEMRLRIKVGQSIYVSTTYIGNYNYNQFKVHESSSLLRFVSDKTDYDNPYYFLGASLDTIVMTGI